MEVVVAPWTLAVTRSDVPVLVLVLIPLLANWSSASRAGQTDTRDFAADLLNSVEPYGILVTAGDNDTFPLWYAQEVEGIRRDVLVANTSLLNTEWYTRQMIRRPTADYDAARGPAIYRGRTWTKPQGPPVRISYQESDAVPLALELTEPQIFRKEGTTIVARIEPRNIGYGVMGLARADIFVLYLIRDSYPQRPFYFSRTTGNYAEELGLGRMVVGTGLARKLVPAEPSQSSDIMWLPGEGWFDLPASVAMWDSYKAPDEMVERGHWIDKASVNIPYLYVRAGYLLAQGLIEAGRGADAARVYSEVVAIARSSHLEDAIPSTPPPQLPAPTQRDTGAAP